MTETYLHITLKSNFRIYRSRAFSCTARSLRFKHIFIKENDLKERVQIVGDITDLAGSGGVSPYDAVISDVFFNGSVLGWHNLVFWYHVDQLCKDGRISGDISSLIIIRLIPQGRR